LGSHMEVIAQLSNGTDSAEAAASKMVATKAASAATFAWLGFCTGVPANTSKEMPRSYVTA